MDTGGKRESNIISKIMIEQLVEYDKELLQFLNGYHTPWLDPVMLILTETITWLPLYLFLFYLVIKEYKKESWIILLGVALTILLSDQITASIMKPYFARLRPSREPTLQGLVHLVRGYTGGQFGFASSHAANSFGVTTFFFLVFGSSKRWIGWLFLWAAFITYTRIYLGVHYPGDILVGALVGMICGWIAFKLAEWMVEWHRKRKLAAP
jgi:undecaprenyl-diphosphatase